MASAEELRETIRGALLPLRAAIEGAGADWERAPAAGGEPGESGEESWSARQAAEHVIGADYAFARAIAGALERDPVERPELTLPSAADALAALEDSSAALDAAVATLGDAQLGAETRFGRSVEWVLELAAAHRLEHAAQIEALGGSG